ncbi:MAG: hypothetical protein IH892_18725 [Planctomycetes bacterium]|nr:hypothetical protein [Planctomycetota bacterium]
MAGQPIKKARKMTVYGTAIVVLAAAGTVLGRGMKKAWAVAQRAEMYVKLPERLQVWEGDLKKVWKKIELMDGKVDRLIKFHEDQKHKETHEPSGD